MDTDLKAKSTPTAGRGPATDLKAGRHESRSTPTSGHSHTAAAARLPPLPCKETPTRRLSCRPDAALTDLKAGRDNSKSTPTPGRGPVTDRKVGRHDSKSTPTCGRRTVLCPVRNTLKNYSIKPSCLSGARSRTRQ
ncbi:uncharacterized protein LOC125512486 [Triticum urartu]|uniref:uncharacterized protein LOC125512486 n=1 Tax=Triticum urartu TaxID=4572 RepID=UPI002043E641|nr:uncharacterized protein LOC125512486 [Triticum urartu]